MAPMEGSSVKQDWNFIFADHTFGGECPPITTRQKKPSLDCSSCPVLEQLPADVQEMLLGITADTAAPDGEEDEENGSPIVSGSGAKAAAALRRLSNNTGSESGFGSGLSDGDDDKKNRVGGKRFL